ncbi:Protein SAD1/UNC-84 domain protein 1 [Dichanthelium oligosanthes]|uniref:Protein SAD1/UNC-84 domain protein 1 n=1 Tax=Dichanthelium oligosanthes TaxID=888268 RepID=A0A1E5VGF6_9POAL|nr:Protein SAD1/UNC-84 domain protein 1 [Dichanthelium oligosanthes]
MVQVQLEAVDRKIDGEVGAARADLAVLLEEKRLALEGELTRLDARADDLGDALAGLRRMEFLRKDEFEKFWEEVKGSLASGSGSEVDLDQVRALAREIVMREIEKHAADGIGRVDYAVASGGGRVVRHSEAYVPKRGSFLNGWLVGGNADPQKMIQPSFGEPGQCFAVQGSSGFVEIKLKTGIIPEAVTLEHVSKEITFVAFEASIMIFCTFAVFSVYWASFKSTTILSFCFRKNISLATYEYMTDYLVHGMQDVAYDRSTAPKDCRVSGWYDETPGETQLSHAAKMAALVEFTYDLDNNNVQTFDVSTPDVGMINMIRFDFTSNHGSSLLTCIYRLRVHGHEPVSPGTAGFQA